MYCFQLWPEANVPKRVRTIQAYLLFFQIPTSFSQDISWLHWVFFSLFSADLSSESYPKTTLKKGVHRSFSLCIKTLLLLLNLKLAPISCTGWYSIKGWKNADPASVMNLVDLGHNTLLFTSFPGCRINSAQLFSPPRIHSIPLVTSVTRLWTSAVSTLFFLKRQLQTLFKKHKFIQLHSYVCSLLFP